MFRGYNVKEEFYLISYLAGNRFIIFSGLEWLLKGALE